MHVSLHPRHSIYLTPAKTLASIQFAAIILAFMFPLFPGITAAYRISAVILLFTLSSLENCFKNGNSRVYTGSHKFTETQYGKSLLSLCVKINFHQAHSVFFQKYFG